MTDRDPLQIAGLVVAEKYRIERLVGEGGFAVVYRALHTIWNKPVAIKFFNGLSSAPMDQRDELQQAFIQEGALLTELSSQTAGIVQARDVGTYTTPGGQWMPYMVLEWLDGASLEELLERERAQGTARWSVLETIGFLSKVLPPLEVAHSRGIAHRDIKPANLFVIGSDARAASTPVKLLDFGVAKMVSDNTHLKAALAKTGLGISSFTPQYGAPEQFTRSYGATGPWTDVYAMALVAVELLTGKPALDGDDVVQLGFCTGNPHRRPTARALGADVPDALEAVIARALAVNPHDRHASAGEFLAALTSAASGLPAHTLSRVSALPVFQGAAPTELAPNFGVLAGQHPTANPATLNTAVAPSSSGSGASKGAILAAGVAVALLGGGFFAFRASRGAEPVAAPSAEPRSKVAAAPASAPPAPPPPTCPERTATIPAGQFFQGSDEKDAPPNEKPAHNVKLDAYCIDLYEVTASEYKTCSDAGRCKRASTEVSWPDITPKDQKLYAPLCTFGQEGMGDYPINCVSWEMADIYCKAQDKRLPTEAEWEYATRGPDGRVYPWGDEEPTALHLNACGTECVKWGQKNGVALSPLYAADDGFATLAPVGKYDKGRSRFGPYDVVGNVWEWVADWYADYGADSATNPTGKAAGEKRVIRGGGWNGSYATWLRPSFRYAQDPTATSHGIGFRCAKPLVSAGPSL
jgi:formylglycine-generating enzyme required for sulfatase activity/serine/threonine protein kinase